MSEHTSDGSSPDDRRAAERHRLECQKLTAECEKLSAETEQSKRGLLKRYEFWVAVSPVLVLTLGLIGAYSSGWFEVREIRIQNSVDRLTKIRDELNSATDKLRADRDLMEQENQSLRDQLHEKESMLTDANTTLRLLKVEIESLVSANQELRPMTEEIARLQEKVRATDALLRVVDLLIETEPARADSMQQVQVNFRWAISEIPQFPDETGRMYHFQRKMRFTLDSLDRAQPIEAQVASLVARIKDEKTKLDSDPRWSNNPGASADVDTGRPVHPPASP